MWVKVMQDEAGQARVGTMFENRPRLELLGMKPLSRFVLCLGVWGTMT